MSVSGANTTPRPVASRASMGSGAAQRGVEYDMRIRENSSKFATDWRIGEVRA